MGGRWASTSSGSGEGYAIRSVVVDGHPATAIVANGDAGVLRPSTPAPAQTRAVDCSNPRSAEVALRVLNHWDDLNRHVERGYAGQSIWDWHRLPDWLDPRYTDYARANASIGINGTVLNNVNANAQILTPLYLEKVAALAGVLRPWGIRVYLSARFSAPMEIGGLDTADPLDPRVQRWWRDKATEVYALIPTSAVSWSRPIPKASPARRITGVRMQRARTCSPMPSRRTAAW